MIEPFRFRTLTLTFADIVGHRCFKLNGYFILFPVALNTQQAVRTKKCRQYIRKKSEFFCCLLYKKCRSSETVHPSVFSSLPAGRRCGRKSVTDETAKGGAGQVSKVTGILSSSGSGDFSPPPNMLLVQPKAEPEEQEGEWTK